MMPDHVNRRDRGWPSWGGNGAGVLRELGAGNADWAVAVPHSPQNESPGVRGAPHREHSSGPRTSRTVAPTRIRSPALRGVGCVTVTPFTTVHFVLPRSLTRRTLPTRSIRACWAEALESSRMISLPGPRPIPSPPRIVKELPMAAPLTIERLHFPGPEAGVASAASGSFGARGARSRHTGQVSEAVRRGFPQWAQARRSG